MGPSNKEVHTLSRRRQEVLRALLRGLSEKQVASLLRLSKNTVHVHVKALYRQFRVCARCELLALWINPKALPTLLRSTRKLPPR
jgi:two-component system, NarL family, nitrate/nitrite response regulator NarP